MRLRTNDTKPILWVLFLLLAVVLSGCISSASAQKKPLTPVAPTQTVVEQAGAEQAAVEQAAEEPATIDSPTPRITATHTKSVQTRDVGKDQKPANTPSATPSPILVTLDPAMWKEWPVIPVVSPKLREIYQQGLAQGNDPSAFSVLGDCQSQPEVFMGVYDNDEELVSQLPEHLQETIANFAGSFDRYSPTVKDGTTEGALLWAQWNDNKDKLCKPNETPLECELRVHNPSIVFIHVGTHWEGRNRMYLNRIIDKILERKAIPVLVTKADNRELDERVNRNYTEIATERGLPVWNFWASVQHLPDGGMKPNDDMYLSDEAMIIHRDGALEALNAVWRALK